MDVFGKAEQHESSICHKTRGHDACYDAALASTHYGKHIQSTDAECYYSLSLVGLYKPFKGFIAIYISGVDNRITVK